MRIKRDIEKGQLCTQGGGGGWEEGVNENYGSIMNY